MRTNKRGKVWLRGYDSDFLITDGIHGGENVIMGIKVLT